MACAYGENRGNVLLRKEQYRRSDDEAASCRIARNMIAAKGFNSRWVLDRAMRDHPQRVDGSRLENSCQYLVQAIPIIRQAEMLELLRGLEGVAAAQYFGVLEELALQNKKDFTFTSRERSPPTDLINAMLSFAYTLLFRDCAAALNSVGPDPYVGFLHRDRPGRMSLALDLMEELRCLQCDRFVLSLVNNRVIQPKHFKRRENHGVYLTEDGRKIFLGAWQERKKVDLTHPYLMSTEQTSKPHSN